MKENEKLCPKCKKIKPKDDYFNNQRTWDKKDYCCKSCRKKYSKDYNERNREKVKEYNRQKKAEQRAKLKGLEFEPTNDYKKIPPKYEKDPKKKEGYIYLVQDLTFTNYIKIGKTTVPNYRTKQIKGQMPIDIELKEIAMIKTDDMNKKERVLHSFFHNKRMTGEWFHLTEQELTYCLDYLQNKIKLGWSS